MSSDWNISGNLFFHKLSGFIRIINKLAQTSDFYSEFWSNYQKDPNSQSYWDILWWSFNGAIMYDYTEEK